MLQMLYCDTSVTSFKSVLTYYNLPKEKNTDKTVSVYLNRKMRRKKEKIMHSFMLINLKTY